MGSRYHSRAVVLHFGNVSVMVPTPFAGAGANHIDQSSGSTIVGIGAGYGCCSSAFYCCFCSNKEQFGEFGNVPGAYAACIGLTQTAIVIGTIGPQFPVAGVYNTWFYNTVGTAGQYTCTNTAFVN